MNLTEALIILSNTTMPQVDVATLPDRDSGLCLVSHVELEKQANDEGEMDGTIDSTVTFYRTDSTPNLETVPGLRKMWGYTCKDKDNSYPCVRGNEAAVVVSGWGDSQQEAIADALTYGAKKTSAIWFNIDKRSEQVQVGNTSLAVHLIRPISMRIVEDVIAVVDSYEVLRVKHSKTRWTLKGDINYQATVAYVPGISDECPVIK